MEQLIAKIKHYLSFAGLIVLPAKKQNIIDEFHKLYYDSYLIGGTWTSNKFLGVATQKCPLDLFVYQEIFRVSADYNGGQIPLFLQLGGLADLELPAN